jgi:nucleotide-binding universal stress UspA family protein
VETVVVGVDGSEGALEALRFAIAEARRRGARLRVVTAWHVPAMAYGAVGFAPPYDPRQLFREGATDSLDRALEAVEDELAGIEVQRQVTEGQPVEVLLAAAQDADLLVVGSRGLGGFSGLLLGSVSHGCASRAPCPVVIVPHRERRDAAGADG